MRVVPGAGRNEVKLRDGMVQVRVTAPPADGQANDAVLRLLAAALDRPRSAVHLLHGATNRSKIIAVDIG